MSKSIMDGDKLILYFTVFQNDDMREKSVGMIALDSMGNIAFIGKKKLIPSLNALFLQTKEIRIPMRQMNETRIVNLTPAHGEQWLRELRRIIAVPYYGGPISISPDKRVDDIKPIWLENKAADIGDEIVRL